VNPHIKSAALIQLHYHARAGGVTTVMKQYALAFERAMAHVPHVNKIICDGKNAVADPDIHRYSIRNKELRYQKFSNKTDLGKSCARILTMLQAHLDSVSSCDIVSAVSHNFGLGKNCAATIAFAELVRKCVYTCPNVRFFSVIHDFAEEGRSDLLAEIDAVSHLYKNIWEDRYPVSQNHTFVAISEQVYTILKKGKVPVLQLVNPLPDGSEKIVLKKKSRVLARTAIWDLAASDGIHVKKQRPVFVYPSRMICRKNPVEAILLVCIVCKGTLVLGNTGVHPVDKALIRKLAGICKRNGLPVVFNGARIASNENSLLSLYAAADCCVSTSIAEGFGYALSEPRMLHLPLIGRDPFCGKKTQVENEMWLYNRFPVPLEWVDVSLLKRQCFDRMSLCSPCRAHRGSFPAFSKLFDAAFISHKDSSIDFGCLTFNMQIKILLKFCDSGKLIDGWKQRFPVFARLASFLISHDEYETDWGKAKPYSNNFQEEFRNCFFNLNTRKNTGVSSISISDIIFDHFSHPVYFKPLMAHASGKETPVFA
jgi:hypothetical protein